MGKKPKLVFLIVFVGELMLPDAIRLRKSACRKVKEPYLTYRHRSAGSAAELSHCSLLNLIHVHGMSATQAAFR